MIYATSRTAQYSDFESCTLFETKSESAFILNKPELIDFLRANEESVINLRLTIDEEIQNIKEKSWYTPLHSKRGNTNYGAEYILLGKIEKNKFKIVDHSGHAQYIDTGTLKAIAKGNNVANCITTGDELKAIDVYNCTSEPQFKADIADKYQKYILKSAALGNQCQFNYIIEGEEVKIKEYTGSGKNVIIPKFVTSIMQNAFYNSALEELTLNNGLKAIGSNAFHGCKILKLKVPETVKFIGEDAFSGNKQLFHNDQYTNNINILNESAVIVNDYMSSILF